MRFRPGQSRSRLSRSFRIESLERRTLLSSWINPAGGSFTDPANWDTGVVPGPSDDVTINLAGTYSVSLNSIVSIHSLTLGAGSGVQTLSIASGELDLASASSMTSTGALMMSGSTLNEAGGFSAAGPVTLTSSAITGAGQWTNSAGAVLALQDGTIASPIANQGVILSRGDADSISGALTTAAGSVLRVQGNSAYGAASLSVASGFVSNGLIDLTSADSAFDSTLAVASGSLTTAGGTLTLASAGAGGVRHLNAQLQHDGTLSVEAPMTIDKASATSMAPGIITLGGGDLTINQSGVNPSFTTSGGVNIGFGRTLTVTGAPLTIAGGAVTGSGTLNATVNNTAGALAPSLAGTGRTIYYEPFNYPAGSQLDGQGGWSEPGLIDPYSTDYNTPEIVQNAAGSSTGSLASSTLLTSGRSLRTNGQYSFDDVTFGDNIGGDGGTYWFSVLMRQDSVGNGGKFDPDYGQLVLGEGDDTVGIGKPGAGPGINNWSLETPDSATQSASNVPVTLGTTVLLVVSVQFEAGPDHVTLYVNPAPGADPAGLVPDATLDAELDTFNLIAISTGVNANWTFDEIRIGTSYGDVVPRATSAMTIQGNYTASASSSFGVDLFGPTAGSLYDQLNVNGAVSLAGTLNINAQYLPAGVQTFTILNNDGTDPIAGTFNALPEGAVTFAGGRAYRISYIGGDGNDVTLTHLPGLSVNDISVTEGTGGTTTATFTVSLSDTGGTTSTVQWATQDGTATAPADYTANSGMLTFGPGVQTQTVSIAINPDALDEPDETFSLVLSNPTNAVISDGTGVCTILDDDPPPSISVQDLSVPEGNSGTSLAGFKINLSAPSGKTITVLASTSDGTATAGSDYVALASQLVTFNPGDTTQTVNVTINGDTISEFDETFFLNLSNPTNATLSDAQAQGTILNDDPAPVTASFASLPPDPRTSALSAIDVTFSEAVSGFDLADLQLTRDGAAVSLAGASLSTADNITWTLGNLDPATARAGSYVLSLPIAGSGIQSIATGAPFLRDASTSWKMAAVLGTNSSDVITLSRESSAGIYDIFVNNSTDTADYSVNLATLGVPLQVLGLDGRDTLHILAQPGDSFSVQAGQITRDGTGETITYSSPVEILDLENGAFKVTGDLADAGGFDLEAQGAATQVTLLATQHLDALDIGAGAAVQLGAGSGIVAVIGQLTIDGTLDLADNDLILPGAPVGNWNGAGYDGVSGMIKSGAIASSAARGGFTTLAVTDAGSVFGLAAGQTASFDGQSVSAGDILVKFTYVGDANLDGKVNIDDYGRIDGNVGESGSVFGWYNGDFNLDGKINIDDYGLIDSVIGIQGPPL